MKRTINIALGLCILTGIAAAQETPGWEVSGGYQYTRLDLASLPAQVNLYTESAGLPKLDLGSAKNASGFNFGVQENLNNWFGGVFVFSGSYPAMDLNITQQLRASGIAPIVPDATDIFKANAQVYNFLFGPQFTLRRNPRVQPFVRVLIGGTRANAKANVWENGAKTLAADMQASDTGLALGGGGGVDIRMASHLYFRLAGDFVRTSLFNDTEKNLALSAGITYRIGSR
jgi:hypothetical protein